VLFTKCLESATEGRGEGSMLDPEHLPGYDYQRATCNVVASPMASAAISRHDGGRRLPARTHFPEGRLVPVLPLGVNRTRKARSFIALPVRLLSISAFQEIIRDSFESAGRPSAGNVG
jgi:hypothetical protein